MRYELVQIISRATLLNSAQIECPYMLSSGRGLANGIYAVTWPDDRRVREYDASATFLGPFRSWKEASRSVSALDDDGPQSLANARPEPRDTLMAVLGRWLDQGPR